jgi:TetR/AcrR family transcriptional repressor of nem operon
LESISGQWSAAIESNPKDPLAAVVARYLSMGHREQRGAGCPLVALGADAPRQGADVKASFEAGIRKYLETLEGLVGGANGEDSTDRAMATFSTMVGALMLSRAVNDKRLAKRLLQAAAKSVMGLSAGAAQKGQLR